MSSDETGGVAHHQPPVPGFALTYLANEGTPLVARPGAEVQPTRGYGVRRHLRWAAIGIGVQLLIALVLGVAALPFIEPLHSE